MKINLDKERMEARVSGKLLKLTGLEFDLLYELYSVDGKLINKTDLLRRVWGYSVRNAQAIQRTTNTVSQHIMKIRNAMRRAARGSERLLVNVAGRGYKLVRS